MARTGLIVGIVLIIVAIAGVAGALMYIQGLTLAITAPAVYDGEFDDGYLATEYGFYSNWKEHIECNITSEVLGGADYTSCVYRPDVLIYQNTTIQTANGTTREFDWVFETDGPMQKLKVNGKLESGTVADSFRITKFDLYTYDDTPIKQPVTQKTNDANEKEFVTGVLVEGDYVLVSALTCTKLTADLTTGQNIMKIKGDATSTGDDKAFRVLLEHGA